MDGEGRGVAQEDELLRRVHSLRLPGDKQQWHREAYVYLVTQQHWWCQHTLVTRQLAEVLSYPEQAAVQQIWARMSEQMAGCQDCIIAYHHSKHWMRSECSGSERALLGMATLDRQRLSSWLSQPLPAALQAQPAAEAGSEEAEVPMQVLLGLWEALQFHELLDDPLICNPLEVVLLALDGSGALQLPTEGGKYPGLYKLLTHSSAQLRCLACKLVKQLGVFDTFAELEFSLTAVLTDWSQQLKDWSNQIQALKTTGTRINPWEEQQQAGLTPPSRHLWTALKIVLELMSPDLLQRVMLDTWPSLLPSLYCALDHPPPHLPPGAPPLITFTLVLACVALVLRRMGHMAWDNSPTDLTATAATTAASRLLDAARADGRAAAAGGGRKEGAIVIELDMDDEGGGAGAE
ncbi:hypothetical protein V8C86DRAFT_3131748, partial [Haematococcus lacustris]